MLEEESPIKEKKASVKKEKKVSVKKESLEK
jgi:hypothetical protein